MLLQLTSKWKVGSWGVSTNVKIFHGKRKRKTKIKPDQTMYDQFDHLTPSEIKPFQK